MVFVLHLLNFRGGGAEEEGERETLMRLEVIMTNAASPRQPFGRVQSGIDPDTQEYTAGRDRVCRRRTTSGMRN